MATSNIRPRIDQATLAASEFGDVYHEAVDKRRQAVNKIFREDAKMVWNGHPLTGLAEISKFFDNLPVSSHIIEGMDTQPIVAGDDQSSIVVNFSGKVRYKDHGFKPFTESIILTVQDSKWKIVSDVFRFME